MKQNLDGANTPIGSFSLFNALMSLVLVFLNIPRHIRCMYFVFFIISHSHRSFLETCNVSEARR